MTLLRATCAALVVGALAAPSARAQRPRPPVRTPFGQYFSSDKDYYEPPDFHGNPAYDGRFTFARIKYRGFFAFGPEGPGWAHDYPRSEVDFIRILRDITNVHPFFRDGPIVGSAIVSLEDPAVFKYPVAYMSEPGGWYPNDAEVAAFRSYILKGGFMIFDDFREGWRGQYHWTNLRQQVARALPNAKWVELTGKEPIFHSFFDIDLRKAVNSTSAYGTRLPTYWGIYENNDPKRRLLMIGNVDNDIGESWEYSATGFIPIESSNELYKLGVNYVIYALTH